MKTLTALAIKFTATFAILFIILGFIYGMSFPSIVLLTAVIGIVSYVLGDRLLLPRTNNIVAASIDFGLAFLFIWSIASVGNVDDNYRTLFFASLIGGIGVAICEYFFHIYMYKRFYPDEQTSKRRLSVMNYAMETSEEIAPAERKKKESRP